MPPETPVETLTETPAPARTRHALVGAIVDYGGLLAFALAYFLRRGAGPLGLSVSFHGHTPADLITATWWLVGVSAAALALGFAVERRIAPMPLISGGMALVFGGLTLLFHDQTFIKIKLTVTNLMFAAALFGGQALGKNPLKYLLGESFVLPDAAWRTLTLRYGSFFLAMAALNELVWRTQPTERWMLFRFPGLWVLAVLFSFAQAPFMMKHLHTHELPPPPPE